MFQPAPLGLGLAAPKFSVGGVLSIFTGEVVNTAAFPALSVTVTLVVRLVPSLVITAGLGVLPATPERLSAVL